MIFFIDLLLWTEKLIANLYGYTLVPEHFMNSVDSILPLAFDIFNVNFSELFFSRSVTASMTILWLTIWYSVDVWRNGSNDRSVAVCCVAVIVVVFTFQCYKRLRKIILFIGEHLPSTKCAILSFFVNTITTHNTDTDTDTQAQ